MLNDTVKVGRGMTLLGKREKQKSQSILRLIEIFSNESDGLSLLDKNLSSVHDVDAWSVRFRIVFPPK